MKQALFWVVRVLLLAGLVTVSAVGQSTQEKNKALMKQAYEYFNADNWDKLAELIAPNVKDHNPMPGQKPGFGGIRETFKVFRNGFPDLTMTPNEIFAEGDWACVRVTMSGTQKGDWMGTKATGKKFTIQGFDLVRIVNGKAVERYGTFDNVTMMIQLGMMPPPGQAGGGKMDEKKK